MKNKIIDEKEIARERVKKLKPKCILGRMSPALTATGNLLPCCWLDNTIGWENKEVKKLFSDKKISEVKHVDEIIKGPAWSHFIKLLETEDKNVPDICYQKCTNDLYVNMNRTKKILNKNETTGRNIES